MMYLYIGKLWILYEFFPKKISNIENDHNICSKVEYSIAYSECFQLC